MAVIKAMIHGPTTPVIVPDMKIGGSVLARLHHFMFPFVHVHCGLFVL